MKVEPDLVRRLFSEDSNDRHRFLAFAMPFFAIVAGLMLSGFLVMSGARAAFTDTTDNLGNSLSAGSASW